MKNIVSLSLLLFLFVPTACSYTNKVIIKSPDENLVVELALKKDKSNSLWYSISKNDENIILDSPLGLEFKRSGILADELKIVSVSTNKVNESWTPVYGEKSKYNSNYNEAIIELEETIPPFRKFNTTFRIFNEGIALKYTYKSKNRITLVKELTGFQFSEDNTAWVTNKAQGIYKKAVISSITKACETPLVIEMKDKIIAIGEAALVDHTKIELVSSKTEPLMLSTQLVGNAVYNSTFSTPWRYIMVANSPGELLENNGLVLNLNESNKIENTDWIKPGKIIREVTLTTTGGKACIDFAAKHNLQFIEFDAGWYGHEYKDEADATTITVDPDRSPGPLDLLEVIKYGKSKNIGVILYVNRRALEKQLDELLPLYQSWGVAGLKYGFVNVGTQEWTQWLHDAVRKAAKYDLMVDVHDAYRPTGYSRTYPNFMTQEGIRGDEESPSIEHTLITAFTRMIAGAGDQTNCYLADRVSQKQGGKTAQMAKSILIYSPWQFLYWYDRPEGSPIKKGGIGMTQGVIKEEIGLSFYDALPTVWDDTKVLEGEIGEFATIARKKGNDWFIGSLTAKVDKDLNIELDFLEKDSEYEATIYSQDKKNLDNNTVNIEKIKVNKDSVLKKQLLGNSGLAVIIRKVKN